MFQNQRLEEMLGLIEEKHYISVAELSKRMYVSQATIRRDLTILEKRGLVSKSYGGVAEKAGKNRFVELDVRTVENQKEKDRIARQAASLVEPGDALILDASSTVLSMLPYLRQKNLTIITNSLRIAEQMGERDARVYLTGGLFLSSSKAFAGAAAEKTLRDFYADKLFFSATGVDETGEISDYSELEANLRQVMQQQASRQYFLCDSSKFARHYLFRIGNVKSVTGVLSEKELVFKNGVRTMK